MSCGRILYYERCDGFGVLHYPYEPFNLAVVYSGKNVFVRPIIELANGECYFLYQGQEVNPFIFDLHLDEAEPDWVLQWLVQINQGNKIEIDLDNLTGKHVIAFKAMLERKHRKIEEWLLAK